MVAGIITLATQILGWLIERGKIRAETMKAFYQWAEQLGADLGSSKLRNYATKQQEWLASNPWQETK